MGETKASGHGSEPAGEEKITKAKDKVDPAVEPAGGTDGETGTTETGTTETAGETGGDNTRWTGKPAGQ